MSMNGLPSLSNHWFSDENLFWLNLKITDFPCFKPHLKFLSSGQITYFTQFKKKKILRLCTLVLWPGQPMTFSHASFSYVHRYFETSTFFCEFFYPFTHRLIGFWKDSTQVFWDGINYLINLFFVLLLILSIYISILIFERHWLTIILVC